MNVVLSIKPEYVEAIKDGRKRFEFRKSIFRKKVDKVYIYASSPVSKVVGEFQPVYVIQGSPEELWSKTHRFAGIRKEWYDLYFRGHDTAYAIEIKNLRIYNTPKDIPFHAPQSFRYIETI